MSIFTSKKDLQHSNLPSEPKPKTIEDLINEEEKRINFMYDKLKELQLKTDNYHVRNLNALKGDEANSVLISLKRFNELLRYIALNCLFEEGRINKNYDNLIDIFKDEHVDHTSVQMKIVVFVINNFLNKDRQNLRMILKDYITSIDLDEDFMRTVSTLLTHCDNPKNIPIYSLLQHEELPVKIAVIVKALMGAIEFQLAIYLIDDMHLLEKINIAELSLNLFRYQDLPLNTVINITFLEKVVAEQNKNKEEVASNKMLKAFLGAKKK